MLLSALLLLAVPTPSRCTTEDKSVARRLARQLRTRSSPLTQKWYRDRQLPVSRAQRRAIQQHWPDDGIHLDFGRVLDLPRSFRRPFARFVLDVGFGSGDSLVGMARARRDTAFLGCEIHRAGVGAALIRLHDNSSEPVDNVRLVRSDVAVLLERHLPPSCLDEVCVFFPDPWPNFERDGERRVIRPSMLPLLERTLKPGGVVRVATDVEEYALHAVSVFGGLELKASRWRCLERTVNAPGLGSPDRPATKYELRAKELGNLVWDMKFQLSTEENT